jgi:hypothetical protein
VFDADAIVELAGGLCELVVGVLLETGPTNPKRSNRTEHWTLVAPAERPQALEDVAEDRNIGLHPEKLE